MKLKNSNIFFPTCLSKFYVGSIGGSANIWAIFHFLPHSTNNRCSNFPDSLFQVLNVVNTNTVECRRFASRTPRNKNPGVSSPERTIFCISLGEWASPWIRCARNRLPSLHPHHHPQFHQPRDRKLGEFVFHLTPVSCVCCVSFQQYNDSKPHHYFWDTLYFVDFLSPSRQMLG
jgi:hypothetical protein